MVVLKKGSDASRSLSVFIGRSSRVGRRICVSRGGSRTAPTGVFIVQQGGLNGRKKEVHAFRCADGCC